MSRPSKRQRGSTLLEFVLCGIFLLVPLTLGMITVGMTLARSIRIADVNRAAGHMFARGMDFSQAPNRAVLVRIANGLGITDNGGTGVVILSEIQCTSAGHAVCTRRYVIGNAGLRASSYASPTTTDANGNVDYNHDAGANASSVLSALPMSPGETTCLAETYFSGAAYDWTGFLTGNGTYSVAFF